MSSTEPFSLESTVSVESPRTPDPFSDPIKLCLPMSDESNIITGLRIENRDLRSRVEVLEAEEEKHQEEIKKLNDKIKQSEQTYKRDIEELKQTHKREIEELKQALKDLQKKMDAPEEEKKKAEEKVDKLTAKVKKIEEKSHVLKTELEAIRKALEADIFDKFIESLSGTNIDTKIRRMINKCRRKSKPDIILELFSNTQEDPQDLLRKLAIYLRFKGNDLELNSRIISLFRNVKLFALKSPEPNLTKKNPQGTNNQFQRDHTMKTSQGHPNRIFSSRNLVEKFYEKKPILFSDMLPALGLDYHNESASLAHYFIKAYCELLTKFGDESEIKFLPEPTVQSIRGNDEEQDQQRPDGAAVKGQSTVVLLDEVKRSLGIDQITAKTMKSLPRRLHEALRQSFGYMFAFSCSRLILTDGFVYIKLRIQVEKFLENKEYYTRSKIVPYEFDMFHIEDDNFGDSLFNCLLEGNEPNEDQKLKEMAQHYENDFPSASGTKRRRTHSE